MIGKTVAERLREIANSTSNCDMIAEVSGKTCGDFRGCYKCAKAALTAIADQIEAEQAELRKQNGVDVDALRKLADDLEETNRITGRVHLQPIEAAERIREIVKGATAQLPDGIEWPRFEDGELVKFGGEFVGADSKTSNAHWIRFGPSTFTLTSYYGDESVFDYGEPVKRPEPEAPDTQEAIEADATMSYYTYCHNVLKIKEAQTPEEMATAMAQDLLRRQRKLLGGE